MSEGQSFLECTFGLSKYSTSVRTEFIAGLTTFLTMVYIVFVNPTILGNAGMQVWNVMRLLLQTTIARPSGVIRATTSC